MSTITVAGKKVVVSLLPHSFGPPRHEKAALCGFFVLEVTERRSRRKGGSRFHRENVFVIITLPQGRARRLANFVDGLGGCGFK